MKASKRINFLSLLLLFVLIFQVKLHAQTVFVPFGSTWKYLDNGSDQGTSWYGTGFNDASWLSGNGQFGYGDGDEATVVSHGGCSPISSCGPKHITTYFRKTITIANPASFTDFTLNVRRDDGVVIYINGVERYSNNMPVGRTYTTLASSAASDDGGTAQTATLSSSFFSSGTNIIAVEIHQNSNTSSDISFDLELIGNSAPSSFISYGDTWKYLDNGSDQGTIWSSVSFNDASWASGATEMGYGDGGESTVINAGCIPVATCTPKHLTTYFRKSFTIAGLSSLSGFLMNVIRDDGYVIYVNGVEVARNNMPSGVISYTTPATAAISGAAETTPVSISLSQCVFVEGVNTIAVEIHQSDVSSSDLSFNLQLTATAGGGIPVLTRSPYLQSGNETAITIRWRTNVASLGRVRIGTTHGAYTYSVSDETCPVTDHVVRVTGLQPDTKYFYEVGTTDGTVLQSGTDNFFRTNPGASTTRKVRVAAFGDCGRNNAAYQDDNLANYQSYLNANGIDAPDAWILMGDNAYNSGTDAEYTSKFFGIYGSSILKNHKLYPAPGNHDYGNTSANKTSRSMPYHTHFTVPQNGECGGVPSHKPNYYSFDIGPVHFLSLDSYGVETDGTDMQTNGSSALKTWINADLAANTRKWVVAYWHHPPYTKSSHNSDSEGDLVNIRQNFITYLENRGVDLIICGHSHAYERGYLLRNFTGSWTSFSPVTHAVSTSSATYTSAGTCPYVYNSTPANHGTVYVVAGSAGASGGTNAGFGANAMPYAVNDAGIFYFEVEDNRLDAKMLRRNGTIFDRFTILKDVNRVTNYSVVNGGSQLLTASWPGEHSWSTTETSRSVTVHPPDNAATNYTVTDNYGCVTDQFTVTASGALPVQLLNFDAVLKDGYVELNWKVGSEVNHHRFHIERSIDGRLFNRIGTVMKNQTTQFQYTYRDGHPIKGTTYYRLLQEDFDGRMEMLGLRFVSKHPTSAVEVQVRAGNDKSIQLEIKRNLSVPLTISVTEINGKVIAREHLKEGKSLLTRSFSVNPGVYVCEVTTKSGSVLIQKILVP